MKVDSMPHGKAPKDFKPKVQKAALVGRLAKRNHTRVKSHPIHGLTGKAPAPSSGGDTYLA